MEIKKRPLDLRIIIAFGIISCIIYFSIVIGLILGVAHVPVDRPGYALFGQVILSTDLSRGINDFVIGFACLIQVYGLWYLKRWVWWYSLIFATYAIINSMFSFTADMEFMMA